ncbi:carboxypeptidase regulatory-like domain-containing protein [candidate division TA06 bacterium]|uniref:Carboxypeptidase regulatory-like domain-containing protein n=1 Tax=candidate division TA06 bacterium TaxID=2250710 RepID=A0A933IBS5_UNCT6|nr:carboxypeptidase regulatory-like domain-containing protein [candidate division TA06 bacterium]
MKRFFVSLIMLLLLAAASASAQAVKDRGGKNATLKAADETAKPVPPKKGLGTITGTVTDADSKEPLPGAVVKLLGTEFGANTDSTGRFIITNVKPGTYTIQAKMMGFASMTVTKIKVEKGYTVQIDFPLRAQVLESVGGVIEATRPMVITDAKTKTTVINTGAAAPTKPGEPAKPGDKGAAGGRSDEIAYFKDGEKKTAALTETGSASSATSGKSRDDGKIPKPAAPAASMEEHPPETPLPVSAPRPRPASPGMKAGSNDDNKQFNYYLGYLERFQHIRAAKVDVSGRVVFTVTDADGRPIANCPLAIKDGQGAVLARRKTYADGRAMFFTTEKSDFKRQDLEVAATGNQETVAQRFSHNGKSLIELKFKQRRPTFNNVPLDVVFLLDCTGSMGDEIARLKSTLQVINFQVSQLPSKPAVRFGMVQYRDRGDEYVTRVTPFTAGIDKFQKALDAVSAGGGNDEPEDLQSGLKDAVTGMAWRDDACKLVFLVADAPPHLDYRDQTYGYGDAMRGAAASAIKIITVGASGLNDQGEYVFRQLSQYTMGQFIFLTYGETGEVSGGGTAAVSHHTGSNFQTENLDAIIVRIIKQELANYGDGIIEPDQEYFETNAGGGNKDDVLKELFAEGIRQLLDYSIVRIDESTPAAVMPVAFSDDSLRSKAEVLEDNIVLNLAPVKAFRLVERKDLRQIMGEQKLNLTGAFDSERSVEVGKLIGAKILILPKLHQGKDKLELYLKMVKVETGEIMSITLLKIDDWLI